ncbi:hypothetical protein RDWZM_005766 [Blomia tropicalis]|uniref:Uncharacterized protein n=1 Tax=Blomia tropicalis TaxID=40697 RepID=A0A9Q0RMN3_BLOTA|nr:Ankyrin repeat A protein 2 [Blomia tropicalis]KAJ6219954.1 hypothetical protein RDWZM_005766 [Blomia tropicalis]
MNNDNKSHCDDKQENNHNNNIASRRSAFSPYRPSTVLTNLQRGNIQTQTSSEPPVRNIHQLAALGELFASNLDSTLVNIPDDNGLTPILWAAFNGQLVSLNLLHTHGADPHYKGPSGENALSMASANGHTHVVKALLGLGVNVNATDEDGNTALMYAAYKDHKSCVQELLDHGADLTLENSNLDTAFDISVKRGCKEVQSVIEKHILKTFTNK